MITDEQLRVWKGLADKATVGGWFTVRYGDGDTYVVHSDDERRVFFPPMPIGFSASPGSTGDPAQIKADMIFVAASRTAVPALCEEVARLSVYLREIATSNASRDQLQALARSALQPARG